jgi:hypothetical protein
MKLLDQGKDLGMQVTDAFEGSLSSPQTYKKCRGVIEPKS